jgi:predicted RNA-binding protein
MTNMIKYIDIFQSKLRFNGIKISNIQLIQVKIYILILIL